MTVLTVFKRSVWGKFKYYITRGKGEKLPQISEKSKNEGRVSAKKDVTTQKYIVSH